MISARTYVFNGIALMLLLALTAGMARVDLGAWNVVIAMGIAVAKALLVVTFFMELKVSPKLMWLAGFMGIFWLALVVTGVLIDVVTRTPVVPH